MRKSWKVLPLAAIATVAIQFSFVGAPQAQTTSPIVGGTTGTETTGLTTTGAATTGGGTVAQPVAVQPSFTG